MSVLFERNFSRVFGTWPLGGAKVGEAIEAALEAGYRSFDTAQKYGNEKEVGAALQQSAIPRAELCITTKVTSANFSSERFIPSVEESLEKLDCGVIDLLLLHWPPADGEVGPSLELLASARERGLAREVGVSNYNGAMMEVAKKIAGPIAINQVEFHPLIDQTRLQAAAAELGIPLAGYCSIARGRVNEKRILIDIGASHDKSAAQIALRWSYQQGVAPITKCSSLARARENYAIDDFELAEAEMAAISALGGEDHRICEVEKSVGWDWD